MTTGERIKQRRIELGLTQLELAQRLGNKSRASVCTVEKDKEDLTTTRIQQYAKALECSPAYLMGWEDINGNKTPHGQLVNAYLNKERQEKANALYDQYEKLPPEKQAQFDNFLKFLQSDSGLPRLH